MKVMGAENGVIAASEKPRKVKWLGPVPEKCDLKGCEIRKTFVDGKTRMGPWAVMCENCHEVAGCGIGPGRGQRFSCETLEKIAG